MEPQSVQHAEDKSLSGNLGWQIQKLQPFFVIENRHDQCASALAHLTKTVNAQAASVAFGRNRDRRLSVASSLGGSALRRVTQVNLQSLQVDADQSFLDVVEWNEGTATELGFGSAVKAEAIVNSLLVYAAGNLSDIALFLHRTGQAKPFSKVDVARLAPLRDLLMLANGLRSSQHEQQVNLASRRALLDQIRVGAAMIDQDCQVAVTNKMFDRMIQKADGLNLVGRTLVLSSAEANDRLMSALSEFDSSGPRFIAIPRERGAPLRALIRPCLDEDLIGSFGAPAGIGFVLLIGDPNLAVAASRDSLASAFDLSPAESALAALMSRGASLPESAKALGVTIHTIRSHVRRLLSKTDSRTQADLIRAIASLPG